jgi:hypothetical protein
MKKIILREKQEVGFLTEQENLRENLHFQEMAVLRKKRSGLPANLFLDDEGRWINTGHWKRIKFQPDKGDRAVSTDMVPMSISDDPQILVENAKLSLNSKEIEEIKKFVRNNKELLLQLGDQTIDIGEFLDKMSLE